MSDYLTCEKCGYEHWITKCHACHAELPGIAERRIEWILDIEDGMADFSKWDRANLEAVASDMLCRILKDTATSEAELLPLLELRSKLGAGKSSQVSGKFRIGVAVGLCVGCALASLGWVAFFWLASLSR